MAARAPPARWTLGTAAPVTGTCEVVLGLGGVMVPMDLVMEGVITGGGGGGGGGGAWVLVVVVDGGGGGGGGGGAGVVVGGGVVSVTGQMVVLTGMVTVVMTVE